MAKNAKLAGLCTSKIARWDQTEKQVSAANPLDMDAEELRREVFDLHDLLAHAVADIRFLAGFLREAAGPRAIH